METYYTKREYEEMKKNLLKRVKIAENKVSQLEAKLKSLKEDYDILLETATSRN